MQAVCKQVCPSSWQLHKNLVRWDERAPSAHSVETDCSSGTISQNRVFPVSCLWATSLKRFDHTWDIYWVTCILSSNLLGFSLRPLVFGRYIYWSRIPLESDVIGEWLRSVTGEQNPRHTMTGDQRFVISARVIGAVQKQTPKLKVGSS